MAHDGTVAQHILNPSVGMYEVEADIGPSWGTKREEAFNALTLILTQAPQLTSLIGDLLLKSSDFDLSDEAAGSLKVQDTSGSAKQILRQPSFFSLPSHLAATTRPLLRLLSMGRSLSLVPANSRVKCQNQDGLFVESTSQSSLHPSKQ